MDNTYTTRIVELARHSAPIQAFLQVHVRDHLEWQDTLEAMVLHLASALGESRTAHVNALAHQLPQRYSAPVDLLRRMNLYALPGVVIDIDVETTMALVELLREARDVLGATTHG